MNDKGYPSQPEQYLKEMGLQTYRNGNEFRNTEKVNNGHNPTGELFNMFGEVEKKLLWCFNLRSL